MPGPFSTYVPPGVYTRTLTEANAANLVTGLRIPVLIGVGQEELDQSNLELVRGSSATQDQQIIREDVSQSFVLDEANPNNPVLGAADGTAVKFRVRNRPIVDGQGFGRVTNDTRSVTVTVNDVPVALGQVRGQDGMVTLQVPPQPGDDVRCTYYFHRSDTVFTDDVSSQVTSELAVLTSPATETFEILAGTTDELILEVDGTDSTITLAPGNFSAAAIKSQIDSAQVTGLSISTFTDAEGGVHVRLSAAQSIVIGNGNANGALGFTTGTQTNRNTDFRVYNIPIVDGTDGGITTTDPTKVVATVDGQQVVVSAVDGVNGVVTLPFAPAAGSTVTIQYYHNTFQDTYDYLPNTFVTEVLRSGFSPERNDYIVGQDFMISNPSPDVSIVHWGASTSVSSARRTPGATVFDDTQILPTLVDDKFYLAETVRYVDTTTVPSTTSSTVFTLPEIPTLGNGRDTPLGQTLYDSTSNSRTGVTSNRPDLVTVYAGRNLIDALSRAAVTVTEVDGPSRQITLKNPVPPDYNVYATFNYSRLRDATYTVTNKVPGAVGVGQFQVYSSTEDRNLQQVRFGTKTSLPEVVQWPRGVENVTDAFHSGSGTPVNETVTVTFSQQAARNAVFTNSGASPYSFYTGFSDQWRTILDGTTYVTNLNTATRGFIVSDRITLTGGNLTLGASEIDLNLKIDGDDVPITLTPGPQTPASLVADINAAIDATDNSLSGGIDFTATAPNALASTVTIGTDEAVLIIQSYSTPAALPGGFDHASTIEVRQGTAETAIGFTAFQSASGSPQSINKPATLIGTEAGPFSITSGVNDTFSFRLDGIDYTVSLPTGATVTAASVIAAINAVPGLASVASVGTLDNLEKIRLTSQQNSATSSLLILTASANDTLGFSVGDSASFTQVTAQEVVNSLLSTASFTTEGFAYPNTIDGQTYLTIESLTLGATTSSIAFATGTASAFNETSGTGIVAGTSGDSGEDATDIFTVTSNNASGSNGTGIPGQTYTDETTGLRFTVLPSETGSYSSGGSFTLEVSTTWLVNPAIPYLSIGGIELIVTDTVGVGLEDAAQIRTFDSSGLEPAIGDFYYISYRYLKQDFSTRLFQRFKTVEENFGRLSAENRLTLGAYLAILNGAVLVGLKQVLKEPNTNQASDISFNTAIQELATPLPGNIRPDILVPLTGSSVVFGTLMQHVETMSNIRNQSERIGFIGHNSGVSPTTAQAIAKNLLSNRIVSFYPDSAVLTLTNELGESFEQVVDGTFFAAAASGAICSPAVDVATPYTRRRIVGFTRIVRTLDPVEMNQTAVAGVTLLEDLDPIIRIRQGLTTDMSTILSRLPTVVQIADYVQKASRNSLDAFIGTKFLKSRLNDVETTMTSLLNSLIQAEIIGAFTGVSALVDDDDPTIMRFEAYYQPIFPLLYIVLTFNLRARI